MPIIRTSLKSTSCPDGATYTKSANIYATDKRLSWEARGIMAFLLTKPDGWKINRENLVNEGIAGGTVVRRVLRELTCCGYLVQVLVRDGGKFSYESFLYENPADNEQVISILEFIVGLVGLTTRTDGTIPTNGHRPTVTDRRSTDSGEPYHIVITESVTTESNKKPTTTSAGTQGDFDDGSDLGFAPIDKGFKAVSRAYKNEIGAISPIISQKLGSELDEIRQMLIDCPQGDEKAEQWILYAIEESALADARSWRYCEGILNRIKAAKSLSAHRLSQKPKRKERNYASNKSGIVGLQDQSYPATATPKLVFDPATGQTYAQ